jgi:hypothetical protein
VCVDRQVSLDGMLGGTQIVQAMSMADGQVRDDDIQPAFIRRERGKRLVDAVGQGAERSGFARAEPEHVLTEPVCVVELEADRLTPANRAGHGPDVSPVRARPSAGLWLAAGLRLAARRRTANQRNVPDSS